MFKNDIKEFDIKILENDDVSNNHKENEITVIDYEFSIKKFISSGFNYKTKSLNGRKLIKKFLMCILDF